MMAGPNGQALRARRPTAAQAIHRDFRPYYMVRRPDWNKMGRRLPLWFRRRLRRIDPLLTLQFVPPDTKDPEGVPAVRFPEGVWYICARVPRARRWLAKRVIFPMALPGGQQILPSYELLRTLRTGRLDRKKRGINRLEKRFQEQMAEFTREKEKASREELLERIAGTMRRLNMSSYAQPRVFIPAKPGS